MAVFNDGSRDSDKKRGGGGGDGHPDSEIRRGKPGLQKKFFRPSGPQFGLKIRGGEGVGGLGGSRPLP